jgi:hypothetical protein
VKFTSALVALVIPTVIVLDSGLAATPLPACVHAPSQNTDASDIIAELGVARLMQLETKGQVLPDGFFDAVKEAQYVVCADRTLSATVLARKPPVVAVDELLVDFALSASGALIIGGYLAERFNDLTTLQLYNAFLAHVVEQNAASQVPAKSMEELVSAVSVGRTSIEQIISDSNFRDRFEKTFLNMLGFVVQHEQCHIFLKHAEKRSELLGMLNKEASTQQRESAIAALQVQESEADECAIGISMADEYLVGSGSPAAFFGALVIIGAQTVIEAASTGDDTARSGNYFHPTPFSRLELAGEATTKLISKYAAEDVKNSYLGTVDGIVENFRRNKSP